MSEPFSPLILPTEDNRGLQSSLLTVIDALNVVTPRLGVVEDILAAAGLATRRIGAIPMTWLGVWTASFVYLHGDVVTRNLLLMIANKTTAETPTLSANDWDLLIDGSGSPAFHAVKVFSATATTSIGITRKSIVFDQESYDPFGLHDTVTNNTRLTADVSGYWDIAGQMGVAVAQAFTIAAVTIKKNGTTRLGDSTRRTATPGETYFPFTQVFVQGEFLNAGEYVELQARYSPTATSDVGVENVWFSMRKVGS